MSDIPYYLDPGEHPARIANTATIAARFRLTVFVYTRQMRHRILLVQQPAPLGHSLSRKLRSRGFDVALATDGPQALNEHACFDPHLVLLDLTVHSLGGLELFKKLNASQPRSGIILLTENWRKAEGVEGLRLGADDFLTKPVSFDELFAHITAVLRRVRADAENLVLGSLHIDFTRYAARRGQESIPMSTREIDVLRYMKERVGRIVGRDDLLRKVWGIKISR